MLCVDILGDYESVMAIVNNPSSASRSKHIGVKSPFFEDLCVQERLVFFMYEQRFNTRIFLRKHYGVRSS